MQERHRNRSASVNRRVVENLHRARGPIAKAELLRNRFSTLSAREGQYAVKILTGDLRIGLGEVWSRGNREAFALPSSR